MNQIEQQKIIITNEVDPILESLIHQHLQNKNIWYPSELLPPRSDENKLANQLFLEIKERTKSLSDTVKLTLVLSLLTEEGLPLFHRLLYEAFGAKSLWEQWRDLWTSEEDKHGNVLRDYVRDFGLCNFLMVEKMQAQYLQSGWSPPWRGDMYGTIAYTAIQERATQISHRNLSKLVNKVEPTLSRILSHIAGDESRHFNFYCSILKKIVEVDLYSALANIANVIKRFTMPGINLPGFSELAQVEHAINVFGPKELAESIQDVINFTGLDKLKQIPIQFEQTLTFILQYPHKLTRIHERYIDKVKEKITLLHFDILPHGLITT